PYSTHLVSFNDDVVERVMPISKAGMWINGGYFVFRSEIFDYMKPGEELVEAPFERLISDGQLLGHQYDGYWRCMDTFKDQQQLDDLYQRGRAPWEVWKKPFETVKLTASEHEAVPSGAAMPARPR